MRYIDLRSDTVTKPSKPMREAMMVAEVGDDVFGEDPTINKLQDKCAELTGKERALFVTSGSLGNQLAVKAHTKPGDEIIVEAESHIYNYENAAPSVISGVQVMPIQGTNGVMSVELIKRYLRDKVYYFPENTLICIENTHNRAGGIIQPIESIREITVFAKEQGIKTHLDGARIFNASVETGITIKEYASYFDSISFCFSKGLGAPVGSILCGDASFIARAHKWRKILGGGMRQAGILAAAALYALEHNIERLKEDHQKAKFFAQSIASIPGVEINLQNVHTNIVIFRQNKFPKSQLIALLKERGVLVSSGSFDYIRAVFHLDVSLEEVEESLKVFQSVLL
ncbi:MAG: low-specificity L-threonine aldolase [Ignavibacteria bacterium]